MIFLLFSILSATAIALVFKSIERFQVNTFFAIVVNYFVAAILGISLMESEISLGEIFISNWVPLAVIIGVLFIIMFYAIGVSTQKVGISVTTVATRMAVVIPITFSIVYYHEHMGALKIIGIVLAMISVFFSTYKPKEGIQNSNKYKLALPVFIFFGAGFVDSLVKFSQDAYVNDDVLPVFSAILFAMAFLIGLVILIVKKVDLKMFFKGKVIFWGIILGMVNFGSIFFFVSALNKSGLDSSVVFGVNHIGIVALTVFGALLIFKERLNSLNWIGIVLSFITIFILSKY